jgi:hypothetical protein
MSELLRLHMHIELMKGRLVKMAERYGVNHPHTLAYSRRVDHVIADFERLRRAA